ncbi:hypothetical protein BC629DRAFT_1510960 [Irpex lacteus]|nr:hypothetical protein BC629DRAFT_1510960 [Irpex lacteus]
MPYSRYTAVPSRSAFRSFPTALVHSSVCLSRCTVRVTSTDTCPDCAADTHSIWPWPPRYNGSKERRMAALFW